MKPVISNFYLLLLCSSVFALYSCSKEAATTKQQTTIAALHEKTSSIVNLAGDTFVLTLQPGPQDGQDSYVAVLRGDPDYAISNYNFDPELAISAWTIFGQPLRQRAFIKFTGLSTLPATAKVVSAQLSLYGLDPNTSFAAPQGNSIYPGSPFNNLYKNNGCYVSAVTGSDWSEDSITWKNKPIFFQNIFDGKIPSSTSQWNYDATADVTKLVKAMLQTNRNYGFCIHLQNEEIYRCILFSSSEAANAAKRPKLTVKYTL